MNQARLNRVPHPAYGNSLPLCEPPVHCPIGSRLPLIYTSLVNELVKWVIDWMKSIQGRSTHSAGLWPASSALSGRLSVLRFSLYVRVFI